MNPRPTYCDFGLLREVLSRYGKGHLPRLMDAVATRHDEDMLFVEDVILVKMRGKDVRLVLIYTVDLFSLR